METALLLLILLLPLLLWWLARRHGGTKEPSFGGLLLVLSISICSALAYGQLGAFGQWQQAYVDQHIDLQLAGRITEARRQLAKTPQQPQLMLELVALYNQGGLYPEAVQLQQQLIELQGPQPELLAQLAELQYYRDQRNSATVPVSYWGKFSVNNRHSCKPVCCWRTRCFNVSNICQQLRSGSGC
ncbi:MAG: hypothetical protein LRY40_00695 [Shewanella fodinae]|nr:hypothetical protein [Shewanella fodinae]